MLVEMKYMEILPKPGLTRNKDKFQVLRSEYMKHSVNRLWSFIPEFNHINLGPAVLKRSITKDDFWMALDS